VLNRLAIVQVWPGVEQARVDGLLGVYSPRRDTYRLSFEPGFLPHPIPDNSTMAARGNWLFLKDDRGSTSLPDLRIDVAGLNSVALQGLTLAPTFSHDLTFRLDSQDPYIEGGITNHSRIRLQDSALIGPGRVQHLGEIIPNQKVEIDKFLLADGRATQAGTGQISSSGAQVNFGPAAPYNDRFVLDLLGANDFYQNADIYRRFNLLSSAINYQSRSTGRGGGLFLAGWSQESPLGAGLEGQRFSTNDSTLYMIALDARLPVQASPLELPPGLFNWSVLEASSFGNTGPYDAYLEQGSYSLRFSLALTVPYHSVESLTLHLMNPGASTPLNASFYLWDFSNAQWVIQPVNRWGDHLVDEPDRYVGTGGEVRLKVEHNGLAGPISIAVSDFTLVVDQ
jgi:hypothetical protein